ncbi:MAG: hypothetical protein RKR03_07215 [Candidatus Competibacter sp.]|nr:hypothetical protein [Candidatus Competibacter sp.]
MGNRQHATIRDLINEIRRLSQEKVTGTLFITGDNNRLAQIGFSEGKIILLSCQNQRGMEAIPLIQQIPSAWFQFVKTRVSGDYSLPATAEILAALGGGVVSSSTVNAAPVLISEQILAIVQDTLAEYIGPIALLLCNDRLRNATSLEAALDVLAKEISNPQTAQQFKDKVRKKLR